MTGFVWHERTAGVVVNADVVRRHHCAFRFCRERGSVVRAGRISFPLGWRPVLRLAVRAAVPYV